MEVKVKITQNYDIFDSKGEIIRSLQKGKEYNAIKSVDGNTYRIVDENGVLFSAVPWVLIEEM